VIQLRAVRWTVLLLAIMAISVAMSACGGSESRDPMELVPARANLLGSLNLTEVLADADVAEAYGLLATSEEDAPATLADLLALSEEELGLDLSGFGQLVVFADVDSVEGIGGALDGDRSGSSDFFGILAPTDLNRDELFDAVRAGASVQAVDGEHDGVPLLQLGDGDGAVALVDGVVVLGSPEAVQAVIDVSQLDALAISGAVLSLYNDLGEAWGKLAIELPGDVAESFGDAGELGLPVDVSALLEFNALGVAATKDATDAIIQIVLRYPTSEAATETQEEISALLALVSNLQGDDQLGKTLGALAITSAGNDVTIEFRQSVQETLDDLRQSLEDSEGANPFGIGL
jgi:hypothetical protein